MSDANDVRDAILNEAASGVSEVTGDSGSVKNYPLKDRIEAAKYGAAAAAGNLAHRGLRFTKLVPPGTA